MKLSRNGLEISRISLPRLAWFLVMAVMFWHLLYVRLDDFNRKYVIDSDGAGYYAYLPAYFIYHDHEFKFCQEGSPTKVDFPAANHVLFMNRTTDGKLINKYFIGTAILESPFFFAAYASAPAFGHHMNGYSFPFQVAIALAAIFYCLIGLDQVRRLLNKKGVSEPVQALTLLLLFFGTNLFHYALNEPSMSHVYSFCMIAIFLNQVHNVFHKANRRSIIWSLVALAMIVLIRPVNGVVIVAVPLIAGSWPVLKSGFVFIFKNYRPLLIGSLAALTVLFLQLLVYKFSVGSWMADSYSGEHIDLTNSHIHNVLFSWRKGFFVYTPMMILAVAGFLFLKTHFERIAFLAFFMINVWVIAGWQLWSYGGSLGMRPLIDSYAVMCIPLAFFVQGTTKKWWTTLIVAPFLMFLVLLNLVQHYQYKRAILPYDEMTREIYMKIFFRTDSGLSNIHDPGYLRDHTLPQQTKKVAEFKRTFEEGPGYTHGYGDWGLGTEKAFSGTHAVKLDTLQTTGGLAIPLSEVVPDSLFSKVWIVVRAKVFLPEYTTAPKISIAFRDSTGEYAWTGGPLFGGIDKTGEWQDFAFVQKLVAPQKPGGQVAVYLFHTDKSVAYADDFILEFWVEE